MSNVLAIAAVTQLLKDMLNDALINGNASDDLGADFTVTALPPDRVVNEDVENQATQLNLFLHRVTPNMAMRNMDLPTRNTSGELIEKPCLALNLHYILTAVSAQELHAEILLGYAMLLFHEQAVLPRENIRTALSNGVQGDLLPSPLNSIAASELADQIELLKITPQTLSIDDMSKMWTALQANYRTTVAYDVSLVLIERTQPTRPSLPVLSRGPRDPVSGRDHGVQLRPDLVETVPTLLAATPTDDQPVMRLGGDIELTGHGLGGGEIRARFIDPSSGETLDLLPLSPATPSRVLLRLPGGEPLPAGHPLAATGADPGAWRIGTYTVELRLLSNERPETLTNALPVALAPAITAAAAAVPGGTEITLTTRPPIRPDQSVAILVGRRMQQVPSPATPEDTVSAVFADLPSGVDLPVRLRVDNIDSPVINRQADPPVFETVAIP